MQNIGECIAVSRFYVSRENYDAALQFFRTTLGLAPVLLLGTLIGTRAGLARAHRMFYRSRRASACPHNMRNVKLIVALLVTLIAAGCRQGSTPESTDTLASGTPAQAPPPPPSLEMGGKKSVTTFFVTSRGLSNGGDLGGLAGADAHCQALADAEGSGDHTWRAYLSTSAAAGQPAVNARDRIGKGPWYNAEGTLIAATLDDLHGDKNGLTKATAVTEKLGPVNGVGDTPNTHDILTGSRPDGTAFPAGDNLTCNNWTSSSGDDRAQVGHHDRRGVGEGVNSWNSVHASRGCSQQALEATGGAGLFYCFAID